jgi:hypothetical protein
MATPYEESAFVVRQDRDIHELPAAQLAQVVLRVIQQESPVHEDVVVARVRDLWELGRAGSRIQEAIGRAIRLLIDKRSCFLQEGFLVIPDAPVRVRSRENVALKVLSKPEYLPPQEIRAAIVCLVKEHHGASQEEIPSVVCRMLGSRRMSAQLRSAVEEQLNHLLSTNTLKHDDGWVRMVEER